MPLYSAREREAIPLGIAHTQREMRLRLRDWGYEASREGCQEWLRRYRTGDASTEGNAAVYEL